MSLELLAQKITDSFNFFVKDVLCASPTEDQQQFIDAVQNAVDGKAKKKISIRSGHGCGKTACLAWAILWIGITRKDVKIPATAPVSAQLTNLLLPEVRKWANKTPEITEMLEVQSQDIKFFNGNHCFARTARKENTEALAGVHASFVLYIVDEASGVDQAIFDVIEGALTGNNFLFIMTSNPTRTTGTFYDSHTKKCSFYQTLHFDSEKSTNVSTEYAKEMELKYGRDSDIFNVRVKGIFPKQNTGGLFSLSKLDLAMNDILDPLKEVGVSIYGLDVARYGNDTTKLAKRKGFVVPPLLSLKKKNTVEVASFVAHEYSNDENVDAVAVDTIGLGAGVFDQLSTLGLPVIDANASFAADSTEYLNKRAEMYFSLKDAIDKGLQLPIDEELKEELLAITYSFTPSGKIKLISKEELKEILGRSPDKADAVALTFHTKIIPSDAKDTYWGAENEW